MRSRPIGVFDSGLGGLTVVQAIHRELPREKLAYFGDTARIPYGTKAPETIIRYSRQIVRFLLEREKVKAVVVACNTSSAWALPTLRREFKVPILGVVEPGAATAVSVTRNGRIGVIGTEGTIASKAYPAAIRALAPKARVFAQACPLFVPLVEEGKVAGPLAEAVAREYLRPLLRARVDTLLLGCTHYPLLRRTLSKVAGKRVRIVDSAEETARSLHRNLEARGIELAGHGGGTYYVSDLSRKFKAQAQRFLGRGVPKVEKVFIEKY
ncbi:MAG TPA: glutamate racemase [bacterium]|nr:glutamate racemase [bacterium]